MTEPTDTPPPPTEALAASTARPSGRPRESERLTRKRLHLWDRVKIVLLFLFAWLVLFWAALAQFDPKITASDAYFQTLRSYWWLLALAGVEVIRQLHYLVSEHWVAYHRFWTRRFFGGIQRRVANLNDWTRYRIGRMLKVLFWLAIIDLALAKIYHANPATAWVQLPVSLVRALPFVFQIAFGFSFVILQFVGLFWFLSRGGSEVLLPDEIETRFEDVRGQDSVLSKVKETVMFLEHPQEIEDKGGKVPRGILLWGPPGTGKTLMAKAVAGETSKPFISVEPSAFMNMFVGVGALKVKSLFRKARKLALRYGGVIMFFDEADSLGNRGFSTGGAFPARIADPFSDRSCHGIGYLSTAARSVIFQDRMRPSPTPAARDRIIAGLGGMGGGGMGILPSMLSELDGMEKPRGFMNRTIRRLLGLKPKPPLKYRILTMMATNLPEALDPALLRPGRLDRLYKVGYPSKNGRIDTYRRYLGKVKHVITEDEIDRIATITPYYGGAQIEDIVNAALIHAIEHGRDTVEWQDLVKAKQLKDLGPPEDVEYIERERHAVAVHEACHAVTAYRVRQHMTIDLATIEKGGTYLGMVASIPPEDQFTRWRSEFEADIKVGLASLAGERMFFGGDSSSGVSGDLDGATRLATYMEGYWGMGSTVAVHGVIQELGVGNVGQSTGVHEMLKTTLGTRIEERLSELLRETETLLEADRLAVLSVAHALETNKTLTGEDVAAIIEGEPGPLVDGRPYHRQGFLEAAEGYHEAAKAAHRAHTQVLAGLPTLAAYDAIADPSGNGNGDGHVRGPSFGSGTANAEASLPRRPDQERPEEPEADPQREPDPV